MLLRLTSRFDRGLVAHIQLNRSFSKCPVFVVRHCDNSHHPLVGGWSQDTYRPPQIKDNQWFTSLFELFYFLHGSSNVGIPQCWNDAFQWVPTTNWKDSQTKPLTQFLQYAGCYIHEEPPYQVFFNGHIPHYSQAAMEQYCRTKWSGPEVAPIPTYPQPHLNLKKTRQMWTHFLTTRQIVSKETCAALFQPKQSAPLSLRPLPVSSSSSSSRPLVQ